MAIALALAIDYSITIERGGVVANKKREKAFALLPPYFCDCAKLQNGARSSIPVPALPCLT